MYSAIKLQRILRGNSSSSTNQSDVRVLICSPWVLGDGAFEVESLTRCHIVHVFGHRAIGVFFDEEINISSIACNMLAD